MIARIPRAHGASVIAAGLLAMSLFGGPAKAADPDFQVTLLGTGTPPPIESRFGPATLVEVNGKRLLFDAGRGVAIRLWQEKVALGSVDTLFLTHLHSDHVVGIPDLYLTGWLNSPFARREGTFKVVGPEGTTAMMEHLRQAFDWDVQTRTVDQGLAAAGVTVEATDMTEGVVYDRDGVVVTAFKTIHGEKIDPAYGFTIEYDGRKVTLSGDTVYNANVIKHGTGADLFVHHVAAIRPELLASAPFWKVIMAHHTEPADVGRVFAQAKPRMAALTHLVLLTNGKIKPVTFDELAAEVRTTYDGPLTVGKDRMRFIVGKDAVTLAAMK